MSRASEVRHHVVKSAEFHTRRAAAHLAKCEKYEMDDEDRNFHKAAYEDHEAMAQHFVAMCKAIDAGDLAKSDLQPSEVSAINPTPGNVRPVLRVGQREISRSGATTAVEKIVGVTFDDED
jgi:hypothetical protein